MVVERLDGVREAEFSYRAESGVVTYDSTRTTIEEIIRELQRMTDYEATFAGPGAGSAPPAEPDDTVQ